MLGKISRIAWMAVSLSTAAPTSAAGGHVFDDNLNPEAASRAAVFQ